MEEIENATNFLNRNIEFNTPISAKPNEILEDLEEAVNLICLDGLTYLFVHRSFQEYFTAYFIIKMEEVKTEELLNLIATRHSDSVLKIAYQMKPATVMGKYILPKYQFFENIGTFNSVTNLETAKQNANHEVFSLVFYEGIYDPTVNKLQDKPSIRIHSSFYGDWILFRSSLYELGILSIPATNVALPEGT